MYNFTIIFNELFGFSQRMHKETQRLLLIFLMFCTLGVQSPACAKGLKFFHKDKTQNEAPVNENNSSSRDDETTVDANKQEKSLKEDNVDESDLDTEDSNLSYVKYFEIMGNNLIETSFIREYISSKEGHVYDRKAIAEDLNKLYSTGYFTQNIRAVPLKMSDGNIRLRIIVEENQPIEGFTITGNESIPTADILEVLSPLEGKPQNIVELNLAIERIQDLYNSRGYILARVTQINDDPDGYVNLQITEGTIGDIKVVGNTKTKDFIVKRNILSAPGQVYNENVLRSDVMRLVGTQAFADVYKDVKLNEETGMYDVTIEVEEARTGTVSLGVGIDSSSGFFGSVGFGANNFRGMGQKLNFNLMAGTGVLMNDNSVLRRANWQAQLSFLEPHFKKENQYLGFNAFYRSFGSYQVPLAIEQRFGGSVTLGKVFEKYPHLQGSITLEGENIKLKEGDEGQIKNLFSAHGISMQKRQEQLDGGFYIRAIPTLTYDTRNETINPRHGVIGKISLDESLSLGSAKSYTKLEASVRKFIPAGRKSSFVVTASGGGALTNSLPEFAMYSLGGPYSIRGFNISEVGVGKGYMMASLEYRTPIPFIDRLTSNTFVNNIRLAGFVDGGKIFSQSISDKLYDRPGYAISVGAGVRIFIPGLGPINLDYGFPLTNTKGSRSSGFFTFGMGDQL